MVTAENLHALKNAAVTQSDLAHAEVGHGFKFIRDAFRHRARRRDFAKLNRFAPEPFPEPAAFERIRIEPQNKNRIFAVTMRAVVVAVPEIKLVFGRVGIDAINQRLTGLRGGAGGRRVK